MNAARTLGLYAVLTMAGCLVRPYEQDPLPVNARYAMKYKEPCSSWLRSPLTGYHYCASPPFTVQVGGKPAEVMTSLASGPTDEASLKAHGEHVYKHVCSTCHQPTGMGLAGSFPPLAGSGEYYGDARNHARIIVHGLTGPIQVQGVQWSATMPPQGGALSDYDIAAVATFERLSWGNNDGIVMPEDVAAVR
jgi:mono/diheme cytochrome c family protein